MLLRKCSGNKDLEGKVRERKKSKVNETVRRRGDVRAKSKERMEETEYGTESDVGE